MTAGAGEKAKTDHRVLLGAHRYTIFDGIVRSAEGVLRTALSAPQTKGGTYSSPFGACGTYPYCVLAFRAYPKSGYVRSRKFAVATHHTMRGGEDYGGENGQ